MFNNVSKSKFEIISAKSPVEKVSDFSSLSFEKPSRIEESKENEEKILIVDETMSLML